MGERAPQGYSRPAEACSGDAVLEEVAGPRPLEADDNRDAFDSGNSALNAWFRRNAWRNQAGSASRTSVLTIFGTPAVVAYVSLSAAQIARETLAGSDRRNQPDPMPAILLGQLAVDRAYQGCGHGGTLLQFALQTCLRLSAEVGCFGVITHPIDDAARRFYGQYGFMDVPFDPRRSMIVRINDILHSGL